ncbi:UBC-like protein, partial [Nadsonia fulvescens var. elongata DSM 6958]
MSSSRLRKDIQSLYASPPADIILSDFPSDLTQLTLSIIGPAGTPFESHEFQLALKIPSDYPCRPPTVAFRTKIFHPNIHPGNGDVCVDTLKRDWTTALDLIQVLVTIRCLLIEPNPASALNEDAGKLILHDWNEWVKKAKLMTRIHA